MEDRFMRKILLFTIFCLMLFSLPVSAKEAESCIRDSFFPESGNCGYDVERYDLHFTWTAEDDRWQGDETLTLVSEWDQDELRFDFDEAMTITELTVNGSPVPFALKGSKLTLFSRFSHDTRYEIHARFTGLTPRGTVFGADETPEESRKSGLIVENEPVFTGRFFICNDTPRDKALMNITMTVPGNFVPICGGRLTAITEADGAILFPSADFTRLYADAASEGTVTYRYEYAEPLAPYLAAFSIGKFDLYSAALPGGRIQLDAIDSALEPEKYQDARKLADLSAEMIAYFASLLGDYPFRDSGSIIFAQQSYSALETQTRSTYDGKSINGSAFAHEIAHQWIGDYVTISDWSDIWMKEGFAVFAEALWEKHIHGEQAFENTIHTYYELAAELGTLKLNAEWLGRFAVGIPEKSSCSEATAFEIARLFLNRDLTETERQKIRTMEKDGNIPAGVFLIRALPAITNTVFITPGLLDILSDLFPGNGFESLRGMIEPPVGPMGITKADVDNDIADMYRVNTYYGGMMVYAVLYRELGEEQFFEAMRLLISRRGNSCAGHQDLFDAFAEVSGRDIETFIAPWLNYEGHIPHWTNEYS